MSTTDLIYFRYGAKVASAIQVSVDSLGEDKKQKKRDSFSQKKHCTILSANEVFLLELLHLPKQHHRSSLCFGSDNLKAAWKASPSWELVKNSGIKIAPFCLDTAARACSCQGGFKIVFQVTARESPSQLPFQSSAWLLPNPCSNKSRLLKIPRKKIRELNQSITFRIIFVDSSFPSVIPSHFIMKVRLRFYLASAPLVVKGIEI